MIQNTISSRRGVWRNHMTRQQWELSLNDAVMFPIFLDYDPAGFLHQGIDPSLQDMMRQAL